MKTAQELVKEGRNPLGQICTRKMVLRGKNAGKVRCSHPGCQKMATVKVQNISRASLVNAFAYLCATCEQVESGHKVVERNAEGYIATTETFRDGGVWVSQRVVKCEEREQLKPRSFYCDTCHDRPGGCTECNDDLYYASEERIWQARHDQMTVMTDNPGHSNAFSSR